VEVVASGYGLPEGPRVDDDGALWFCDAFGGGVVVSGRNLAHVQSGGEA
jgi:sugar lactone lactonase YvrE